MSGFPIGRPRFVTIEDALGWHAMAIARHGGSLGLRDRGLLESALAMPRQAFGGEYAHKYPFEMAAAYAFHVAKNHPFVDGNKRVALLCCGSFLRMNGWDLVSEGTAAADAILALIDGSMNKASLADWLRNHSRQRPSFELRDFMQSLTLSNLVETAERFHIDQGATAQEFAASVGEAASAMPVVKDIYEACCEMWDDAGDREKVAAIDYLKTFTALYSIAEDMGYEW